MKPRGRPKTYDRIKIRDHSQYWASSYDVQPAMAFDSSINLLTIYGAGVKYITKKGLNIEEETAHILNHEVIHDVIYNLIDLTDLDVFQRHWPFFWGIDFFDGEWFTTMMRKIDHESPIPADTIKRKLKL